MAASLSVSNVVMFKRASVTVSNEFRAVLFNRLVLTFGAVKREKAPIESVMVEQTVRLVDRGSRVCLYIHSAVIKNMDCTLLH